VEPPAERTAESLAAAYLWWQPAEVALGDPALVLRQIMAMGTPPDYEAACRLWGEDSFKAAQVTAPPGATADTSLRMKLHLDRFCASGLTIRWLWCGSVGCGGGHRVPAKPMKRGRVKWC